MKKSPARQLAPKKTVARKSARRSASGARSAGRLVSGTLPKIANRTIYDSPLKPRHLSRVEIESIVDEICG